MPHLPPTGDRWGLHQSHDLIPGLTFGHVIGLCYWSNPLVAPVQDVGYVGIRPLSPLGRGSNFKSTYIPGRGEVGHYFDKCIR